MSLIKDHNLITYVPDKRMFSHRLDFGISGEETFMIALSRGLINNSGYCRMPKVLENSERSKDANAINGDVLFYHPFTLNAEFVDVKSSNFISKHSIDMFREDGMYFINAFVYSNRMQYFMIRNNQAFKRYVKKYECTSANGSIGYRVNFMDLPSNPKEFGLDVYEYMDSYMYKKLLMEIKVDYESNGFSNSDILKIIRTVD